MSHKGLSHSWGLRARTVYTAILTCYLFHIASTERVTKQLRIVNTGWCHDHCLHSKEQFYLQDVLCFAVAFLCASNFDFCLSFLLLLGIHNVACDLLIPLLGPMGDSSVETWLAYNPDPPEQGGSSGRSLPGCSVSTEPGDESGKLIFSHQFPSNPFASECWIMLLRKIIPNLAKGVASSRQAGIG